MSEARAYMAKTAKTVREAVSQIYHISVGVYILDWAKRKEPALYEDHQRLAGEVKRLINDAAKFQEFRRAAMAWGKVRLKLYENYSKDPGRSIDRTKWNEYYRIAEARWIDIELEHCVLYEQATSDGMYGYDRDEWLAENEPEFVCEREYRREQVREALKTGSDFEAFKQTVDRWFKAACAASEKYAKHLKGENAAPLPQASRPAQTKEQRRLL